MRGHLFALTALFFFACSQGNDDPSASKGAAPQGADDTGMDGSLEEEEGSDADADDTASDDEADDDDTGTPIPDWVDPDVPDGPIPAPEGTDTIPEEGDFDWTGVGSELIGNSFPLERISWEDYPRVGTAQVLDWSDSDACVCFDVDCSTCSVAPCSAETCTYDFNEDHTLTKYHVELRATEYPDHAVTFEVNISADPPITYTNIRNVLRRLESIPVRYWHGLQIITEFGHGIQFLHGSYFGGFGSGAAAYGGMNYIDTQTADVPTLLHELGHTFEQYTRIGNSPTLEPQSNILNPIWRNAIRADDNRTSRYGNSNEWEDMAEFSRIHALCLVEGSLEALETQSPERYRIWERILLNGSTIHP